MKFLRQNAELRPLGIWNWTIPALFAILDDGTKVTTCPHAGICASMCYARVNSYTYPVVQEAHKRNLIAAIHSLEFVSDMIDDVTRLESKKNRKPHLPEMSRAHLSEQVSHLLDTGAPLIRVHDAGDFFSQAYLQKWIDIAEVKSRSLFYAYTHEVALIKANLGKIPSNFLFCFSCGGKQDIMIDREIDYHADVFENEDAIRQAGYYSQHSHDLLCVVAPSNRIGIPQNNIPRFKKKLGSKTFSSIQQGN